jgi:hypothetical protein
MSFKIYAHSASHTNIFQKKKKKADTTWWHWEAVKVFSILFYTFKIITVKKYAKTRRA